MFENLQSEMTAQMQKTLDSLNSTLGGIRAGRAQPEILNQVHIDYYGSQSPINQVANIIVEGARTLKIQPWEKVLVTQIEKAILNSDVGITPTTQGDVIFLHFPELTEQRRIELTKLAKGEGEKARISIRNIRRDYNQLVKNAQKDKQINEDEQHTLEKIIQNTTDAMIVKVDEILTKKEKDLLSI